jgi:hypothetical protein
LRPTENATSSWLRKGCFQIFQGVAWLPVIIFCFLAQIVEWFSWRNWCFLRAWHTLKSKLYAAQNATWANFCQRFSSRWLKLTTHFLTFSTKMRLVQGGEINASVGPLVKISYFL